MSTRTSPSILIVGSVNTDLVIRTPRFPAAGESLVGMDYHRVAGGKGANQSVAVARLGARATFVGKIGRDPEGEMLRSQLRSEGICTDFVLGCESIQTGLAVIEINSQGENSIVMIPGANQYVIERDVEEALQASSYDAVILQLEIPAQTVIAACRLANERNIPVVLDAGPAQEFPLEKLERLDILSPNETETFMLTGIQPVSLEKAEEAAKALLRRSRTKSVVLKLGDRGALLHDREGSCEYFPAYAVDPVDTTAAGDAFTAAMTIRYLETGDLRQAIRFGNAAGALATMTLGAQPSLPNALTVNEFCARQHRHVR